VMASAQASSAIVTACLLNHRENERGAMAGDELSCRTAARLFADRSAAPGFRQLIPGLPVAVEPRCVGTVVSACRWW